jgi:AcrR family transcriptional regulator
VTVRVVGDDPRNQCLEAGIPAELGCIELSLGHHDPTEIARAIQRADNSLRLVIHAGRPTIGLVTDTTVSVAHTKGMPRENSTPTMRETELLELAYTYALEHGLADMSLRPLAKAIGSSPRVLLYLFDSKEGLIRALLARARIDELELLSRAPNFTDLGPDGLNIVAERLWSWLAADGHRALLTLWVEGYARSLVDPEGPWGTFARDTVNDWLKVLAAAQPRAERNTSAGRARRTLVLAVLRGALLDLLATGDLARTTTAVHAQLRRTQRS